MNTPKKNIVFGLLNIDPGFSDLSLCMHLKNLSFSWSRYAFADLIIESSNMEMLLDKAIQKGYRYCFIQTPGNIIREQWSPEWNKSIDMPLALSDWIDKNDFFAAGIIHCENWFGFEKTSLLVDLEKYESLGRPVFDIGEVSAHSLPVPELNINPGENISAKINSNDTYTPTGWGWNWIATALQSGIPVLHFPREISDRQYHLKPENQTQAAALKKILENRSGLSAPMLKGMNKNQQAFFEIINLHLENSRKGVFLWNLEPYDDVEIPPLNFKPPLDALYAVAAGFKPNRILHTHGFHPKTEMIYFDYSPRALDIKKTMINEWNGADFPQFVRYLFEKFPCPDTFYHLWHDQVPKTVDWNDIEHQWQMELNRWGGADAFKKHWDRYRQLPHKFIHASILSDQEEILLEFRGNGSEVVWWSNAFFTVFSNWHLPVEKRMDAFRNWVFALAKQNPEIFCYGSDFQNIPVNHLSAGEYAAQLIIAGSDFFEPLKSHQVRIKH